MSLNLPPSLQLPPHLSAHKYFFVCTLTVAAWDTLVLSPRTWRLWKTKEWPALKILFQVMRFLMPVEFTVVAVFFFNTKFLQDTCRRFAPVEPVLTATLLACASAVHVIRVHAIYDRSKTVLFSLGVLFVVQVITTAVACAFYESVPLDVGQGCLSGPKHIWVGMYWAAPTLLYTTSFALALMRSIQSLQMKPLSPWKLMLRDGLNLYASIWIVNMVNVLFWFIITPTGPQDPIRTIVTSMTTVLTTSMTLRIILSVRGTLASGGSFAGSTIAHSGSSRTTHVISTSRSHNQPGTPGVAGGNGAVQPAYPFDDTRSSVKGEDNWDGDGKSSVHHGAGGSVHSGQEPKGVKITINREVEYFDDSDAFARAK